MFIHYHLHISAYIFLAIAAAFAGTVDTIAGGGGLITVPAMISVGVIPTSALGTTRFCSAIGEITAIIRFKKAGRINFKKIFPCIVYTMIGAATGTYLLQRIHPQHLQKVIPFLLLAILIYVCFSPHFKDKASQPKIPHWVFNILCGVTIGTYNGFFGPGTGSFWIIAFSGLLGLSLQQSVIHAKPMNFVGNISSLIMFILAGHVAYFIGMIMAAGQFVGANIGASIVMSKWSRLIKPLFIVVVLIMVCRLFWQYVF